MRIWYCTESIASSEALDKIGLHGVLESLFEGLDGLGEGGGVGSVDMDWMKKRKMAPSP